MATEATIDLNTFRSQDSKVFTGRDRGKTVREKSKINTLEASNDVVRIIIPNDLYSINPSFFEEFLYDVIKKLGKDEFMKKFTFQNDGEYKIDDDLAEGITRILRRSNAL